MNAKLWMRKFAALLPEVYRRELYAKRGFVSIYEFAGKLAGMNHATVDKILNLSEKLKDKPILKSQFETGSVGWSKLEKVAYVATPETDGEWAEKVTRLPMHTLEAYVREYRSEFTLGSKEENNRQILQEAREEGEKIGAKEMEEGVVTRRISFPISQQVEEKLRIIRQEFEKKSGKALGFTEVMEMLLKSYEESKELKQMLQGRPVVKKFVHTNLCPKCIQQEMDGKEASGQVTRHIPAKVSQVIETRSQKTCEFPGCLRPGEIRHHVRRFALRPNHDPKYIVFLCEAHEGILQAGLIENEEGPPALWQLRKEPDQNDAKFLIDQRVAEFRREPASNGSGGDSRSDSGS